VSLVCPFFGIVSFTLFEKPLVRLGRRFIDGLEKKNELAR
jgi:hypothetical protein